MRTCTFHVYREFAAKEEEFYREIYVCIMYGDLHITHIRSVAHIVGFGNGDEFSAV